MGHIDRCPQCNYEHVINTVEMNGNWLSADCGQCGWNSEHRPRLYSHEEAMQEVIDAARKVAQIVHRSDEHFATDAMYRTRAMILREQADALDHRDSAIRRLQWALHRLDAFAEVAATQEP